MTDPTEEKTVTQELLEALQWFVAQKASFDERHGDQAAAYYHFIKQDDAWARTRAAIARATQPEGSK